MCSSDLIYQFSLPQRELVNIKSGGATAKSTGQYKKRGAAADRKSVVSGQSVDLGGRRFIKKILYGMFFHPKISSLLSLLPPSLSLSSFLLSPLSPSSSSSFFFFCFLFFCVVFFLFYDNSYFCFYFFVLCFKLK